MSVTYSIVVPVFNEEQVISETHKRLTATMNPLGEPYEIIYVNDGSSDNTAFILRDICEKDHNCKLICFSRNFGHQTAITAGMDYSSGQAVIVIDADLQDPPEVMLQMISKWKEGYEVVYGRRTDRKGETAFKKFTAKVFYRLLNSITEVKLPSDVGDFRLIDRKVCDALKILPERNRYVRGLVSWVGFSQTNVDFVREQRFAGETKYPLRKMLKLSADAITSFSHTPLRISTWLGSILSICSFIFLIIVVFQRIFDPSIAQGWSSLAAIILFFNGVVLVMLGIIGEYIGRVYDETKARPLYIISSSSNLSGGGENIGANSGGADKSDTFGD